MIHDPRFEKELNLIISNAIREDVGSGDHSSLACIPGNASGEAKLLIKSKGVLAGVEFANQVFAQVDPELELQVFLNDGDQVENGDIAFHISGKSRSILMAERLVLNGMQRMSAIATKTNNFVELLKGTGTKVLDTRKTTPGIRLLEKWAVKIGGGENHRFGLDDMIMLKDNHIDFAGGIQQAIEKTKTYLEQNKLQLKIIVEARNLEEIQQIIENTGIYRILIDNFDFEETRKAVQMIGGHCLTESSGGITMETARAYAECGVDYISSGALTHSVHNMDMSLKAI